MGDKTEIVYQLQELGYLRMKMKNEETMVSSLQTLKEFFFSPALFNYTFQIKTVYI